jgi:hypothetical protein
LAKLRHCVLTCLVPFATQVPAVALVTPLKAALGIRLFTG